MPKASQGRALQMLNVFALRRNTKKPSKTLRDVLNNLVGIDFTILSVQKTPQFWQSWRQIYGKDKCHLHPVVNGFTDKKEIAKSFSNHFKKVSKPNNAEKVESVNDKFQSIY